MLKNYLKIAWRNLMRHKGYSLINVTGLAIGIASCLLLFIVVSYELSYDKFQKNYNQIYRIVTEGKHSDGISLNPGVPIPMLNTMRAKFPQVEVAAVRAIYGSQVTVLSDQSAAADNKKFIENNGIFFTEPQVYDIFSYHFLSGNASALAEPNSVVLSKTFAEKYFSDWHTAIGKLIKVDNFITLKVGAITDDPPANTDLPIQIAISYETLKQNGSLYSYTTDWGSVSSNFQIYALLPKNISESSFNALLKKFSENQYKNQDEGKTLHFIEPLSKIHFDTRMESFGDHVTSRATITTLILIGVLIIIMACINFINLSTAQAVSRSKEVGVRKVLGGNRFQLFWQMMGETAIIVLLSLGLALLIAKLSLPFIKNIASVKETLPLFSWFNISFMLLAAVIITFFSGFYPALILSGFTPALALKNKVTSASVGGISLRRGLVVLQFTISQILMVGTIIAVMQMDYVRNADLGFNKDALYVMYMNTDSAAIARQPAFKAELLNIPGVQSVTRASDAPSSDNNMGTNFSFDHGKDQDFILFVKFGDEDYLKTYGLQMAAGRNFEKSDTVNDVLVNETLIKKLNIQNPADAVGKTIRLGRDRWKTIAGVIKDFKTNSLRESIKPMLIASAKKFYSTVGVKIHGNINTTRAAIEKSWNKFYPEYAINSDFLDTTIANFYNQEEHLSLLYKIFAGLAIFISCLGLYGLVSFMAVQRVKEVGVRKVLGASVGNIVMLFSKEFTILISIAFIIAVPVAWYVMSNWLNNFVYRISINAGVFVLAIIISMVIAWITVGYKAVKAALANPVKSLRTE